MRILVAGALAALFVACAAPVAPTARSTDAARIVAVIPVGSGPTAGIAADGTAVWVPSDFDGSLSRIDPLTNQVTATIRVGSAPSCSMCAGGVALYERALWATSSSARLAMIGIDLPTNRVTDRVPLPVFPSAVMSENDGTVWLASVLDNAVVRMDPSDRRVIARISVSRPARLAASDEAVWATSRTDDSSAGSVVRIDRLTNRVVAKIEVGAQPVAITSGEGSIWVIDGGRQILERLDPRSNTLVESLPVGVLPSGVVAGDGSVWVISHSAPGVNGPALLRVDPMAETVTRSIALGEGTPVGLALGAGSVWVARRNPDTVVRVDPSPLLSSGAGGSLLVLLFVLLAAALATAWAWRRSAQPCDSALEARGGQLAALQRFSANRSRTTFSRRDSDAG